MLPLPQRSPLFPYTTLFRSRIAGAQLRRRAGRRHPPARDQVAVVGDGCELLYVVRDRSEEHTSELQSRVDLVCRLLLEKKKGRSSATNWGGMTNRKRRGMMS